MARTPPQTTDDLVIDQIMQEDDAALKTIAEQAGPPPDSKRLSEADEDTAWETTDAAVGDPEEFKRRLATQGLDPQTAMNLLAIKLRPPDERQAWVQAYTQPTNDLERAEQLTQLALTPFRLPLTEHLRDDPEAWVAKSDQLARRHQKRLTALQEQASMAMGGGYGQMPQEGMP